MVLKNFMRSWGHKFIYDDGTLGALLTTAGFVGVHRCKVGQRDALDLADQEMRQLVIGDATSEFETMVVEATRPA